MEKYVKVKKLFKLIIVNMHLKCYNSNYEKGKIRYFI